MLNTEAYKQYEPVRRTIDPLAVTIWNENPEFQNAFLKALDCYWLFGALPTSEETGAIYFRSMALPLVQQVTRNPSQLVDALEALSSILQCGKNNIPYNPSRALVLV